MSIEIPLKHLADLNPETLGEDTDPDAEFTYVDISTVGRGRLVGAPQSMTFEAAPSRARRVLRTGDTVLSTVRTYLRAVWTLSGQHEGLLIGSTGLVCLRPRAGIDPCWLGWIAQSDLVIEQVVARSVGVSYPGVNPSDVGLIKVPTPSLEEQQAIADYLDRETARIDALLRARKRQMQLLSERGVAYVAEHRKVASAPRITLGRRVRRMEQGWSPQCDARPPEGEEWGVLKVGCVNSGSFSGHEIKALPAELEPRREYVVHDGDLLVSRANTRELVGSAAVARNVRPRSLLSDKLYRLELSGDVSDQFVALWLQTREARDVIELEATGASSSMQNIGQDTVRRIPLPHLSLAEQLEFVSECRAIDDRLRSTKELVLRQVELMRERRQALITAAVTGRLPVVIPV